MKYLASVTDFFKSPNWMMNLLLGGLCVLIPFVGPIVIMGWLVTGFWAREAENWESFPDFDFSRFGKNLERGVWPFLVVLVASMLCVPVMMVVMLLIFAAQSLVAGHGEQGENFAAVLLVLLIPLLYLVMMISMALLLAPLKVRASLTQDFAKSFDLHFVKRFIALTWKEIIVSSLFLAFASFALTMAGMLFFCVGMYFAMVPIYFAWTHLNKQLYQLYLSRGGEPVVPSPKLRESPPPLPSI